MSATPSTTTSADDQFVIPRDGDRDLAFKGRRLSAVRDCGDSFRVVRDGGVAEERRCTEVAIYLTAGNALVTHVRRWDESEGGTPENEEHAVAVHSPNDRDREGYLLNLPGAVEAAIKWLKKDNGGKLGTLSKQAWVAACRSCPELKVSEVETVE